MIISDRTRLAAGLLSILALFAVSAALPPETIGGPAPATATTMAVKHHVVKPGQTLSSIGRLYGMSYLTLASYNSIPSPYTVHADSVLRLTKPAAPLPKFTSSITTVSADTLGSSYRAGCPVGPSSLRLVKVTYYNFSGTASTGELIVHADVAARTEATFRRLYNQRFPVQRMQRVNTYTGSSDSASMAANNTSAFNCRARVGGTGWSQHSYGRAIDVNPIQNPYVKGSTVLPSAGTSFTNRSLYKAGMLHSTGGVNPFVTNGFYWGGNWSSLKDYQHFSTNNR